MCAASTIRRFHQSWQALPVLSAISAGRVLLLAATGTMAAFGQSPKITTTTNTPLAFTITAGALPVANTATVTAAPVLFRLRSSNGAGYRLDAIATFNLSAVGTVAGGDSIAAKDIGVGIILVDTSAAGVDKPRTDTILAGFNYNPAAVVAIDGLTPYTNAAGGRATLADLSTSKKILSGTRIDSAEDIATAGDYLTVTIVFGTLPQYFTPSNFTAVITFTISAGP